MDRFAPSELTMWDKLPTESNRKMTDEEINAKYAKRELRIVTESNREQLPNFVEALKRPNWMELRPFYQRRPRWDPVRQSKLIESFVMNIPVPPLFVYESDLAKYEVMDGQQRITAIQEFYSNTLKLKGLEQWPELNGRIYDKLPSEIRKGIDRRSISYIVLLKESAETSDEEALLRQQVFERLNTGGVQLENQEIRNCIYHGRFNSLLLELTKHSVFREAWGLPTYSAEEERNPPEELTDNNFFSQMKDAEVILRFFALRHAENYRRGMAGFLDLYMVRSKRFTSEDIKVLNDIFHQTIELAHAIYGKEMFHPWDKSKNALADEPYVAYADAVLVGLSRHLGKKKSLLAKKDKVIDQTHNLIASNPHGTFTGQKNTKKDVQERIRLFDEMLQQVLAN
jgi:hypothetical protein